MTRLKLTEADIIRAINDYLQVQRNLGKLMYIRNNTGAIPIPAGEHKRRYVRFGDKGSPDFLVWMPGRYYRGINQDDFPNLKKFLRSIAIEAKSDIGKQSKDQIEWQAEFEAIGGEYYVVRSIDRVMEIFK